MGQFWPKWAKTEISFKQARGARSLGKFPKYRNKKKSEKQIFYPERDFPSLKIVLSTENNFEQQSEEK